MQEQASTASHKNSVSEITIRNLTHERDTVVSQLGVAYLTTEQLKVEKERLIEANTRLSEEIAQLKTCGETHTNVTAPHANGPREKNQRRSQAHQETYDLSQIVTGPQRVGSRLAQDNVIRKTSHGESLLRDQTDQVPEAVKNKKSRESTAQSGSNNRQKGISQAKNKVEPSLYLDEEPSIRKVKKTRMVVEEYSESEATNDSFNQPIVEPLDRVLDLPEAEGATTGDITFLSFLEVSYSHILFLLTNVSRVEKSRSYGRHSRKNVLLENNDLDKATMLSSQRSIARSRQTQRLCQENRL